MDDERRRWDERRERVGEKEVRVVLRRKRGIKKGGDNDTKR